VAFNAARDLRAVRSLIEQRASVDAATLADPTRDLAKLG
jgi:hypothetical protein